ncbi:flavoprotein [Rugosimonospora africana]|uniref:Flavoprotein n=1 Tax=Rugosimonospora africana TaxID=556532 RepID=A0A8J3QZ39_9ACTN|nr:flavoprotein [Rugosimonospora africana]
MIGAGPVGLAAAANLHERGLPFLVLEAGNGPGDAVRQWGHVRLFSPWRYNTDSAARGLLESAGWRAPDPDVLPTGADLVDRYLAPLAQLPLIAPHIRYHARVIAVTRLGLDRVRTAGRENTPFLIRLADGTDLTAPAVIDASGTFTTPNVLGASGIPAHGETDPDVTAHIGPAMPDVLGADRNRYAGRHTLVVGAGHSAANTLLALATLAEQEPTTTITWAIRAASPAGTYGGGDDDALPARGALGTILREHVHANRIRLLTSFSVHRLFTGTSGGVEVTGVSPDGTERTVSADRIVSATGFRPDHSITGELRLDLDPILGSARALASLIDPNQHSCGTVPPHGVDELSHPEPGFYAVGMKSYGRAPTFLMATGYEQVRSIAAALAGDWDAARDVHLDLPETGACSSSFVVDEDGRIQGESASAGCCGAPAAEATGRGLATSINGGLLSAPLTLIPVGAPKADQAGGCCSIVDLRIHHPRRMR